MAQKTSTKLSRSKTEDDWFEYRLEHDTQFLRRIDKARSDIRAGKGTRLEDLAE
jgi:hypothetical protein